MSEERWNILFCECEHGGDLEYYESVLRQCGAKVVASQMVSENDETGQVLVRLAKKSKREFLDKLRASEVIDFVEGMRHVVDQTGEWQHE